MGILDGIVEWIAEQVMAGLDLVTTSVLGALGCDMAVFLRYFPAAETMYSVFVALAIGIILLNWVWQLFKNFGLGAGVEAEDPVKLSIRSVIFILLTLFSDEIVNIVLTIGGTPYQRPSGGGDTCTAVRPWENCGAGSHSTPRSYCEAARTGY